MGVDLGENMMVVVFIHGLLISRSVMDVSDVCFVFLLISASVDGISFPGTMASAFDMGDCD